ncbi:MAG: hypothetical protein AVDCRST_MAG01-01-962 [uncultured Rubrobacteraceae bacterium]|uniref:Allene oxide cyclase barrel-like domain-containing protein n=1 Tax=uncultured Rubrobacteraceae bacterium TaxID=349277 RepID=A0A6J4P1U6_9ACTN|nr:MAG: hypothetical protein AVDCRST_MAG01-01-962 [uncultured Rubrobacteraceae bacterium]
MNITLHRTLMVCVLAGVLALTIALVAAKDVSAARSPAHAGGATQISGIGVYADEATCDDPKGAGADYALILDGDLEGCLYTFVKTAKSSPSGTYRETGRELFVGSIRGGTRSGTFKLTYRFEAKYEDLDDPATEIFGRCQHPIVRGSGTGVFKGVTGILLFKDVLEAGEAPYFPYRGHLRY